MPLTRDAIVKLLAARGKKPICARCIATALKVEDARVMDGIADLTLRGDGRVRVGRCSECLGRSAVLFPAA